MLVLGTVAMVSGFSLPQAHARTVGTGTAVVRVKQAKVRHEIELPILTYHHIRHYANPKDRMGERLSVSPEAFAAQLDWLQKSGYQTLTIDQALALLRAPMTPAKKYVVLTFDDGYEDAFAQALPILQEHAMTGVFYIVSDFLGKPDYLTADQVKALDQAGMDMESHTAHHADLAKMKAKDVEGEIGRCVQALASLLGHPIRHFAYPYGHYNQGVLTAVQRLKIASAVTTKKGVANETSKLLELPRIEVEEETKLADLLR